ncbi:aldehyde dehydrogenase family protein [Tateyamaria omphalii]|uniref:aldehyde dehydrogenase family protein n=1 Tax=Tateyamaria omphalii TaxID=299262 RepID=UPI001E29B3BE|nr:aldehyde dehydrogenase family protein [Tateyamaria omphalii]
MENADVDAFGLAVGSGISMAALHKMTRVQLEMGSKNPLLAMDDCDLGLVVAHEAVSAL